LLRDTIIEMEKQLAPKGFVRIHRSTIVNLDRVTELRPTENGEYQVILNSGAELKLTRNYRDALDRFLK
jgi:two-component system LytT family response regulator